MAVTAGYDVGGAHLKVALAEGGRVLAVEQIACPLWQGARPARCRLRQAGPLIARAQRHAATMTGELCEIFPDRPTGVLTLVDRLVALLGADARIWMGPRGFGSAQEARIEPGRRRLDQLSRLRRGSSPSSWATASSIDMGSTTTDIIPVVGGAPVPARAHRRRASCDGRARLYRPHAHRRQHRRA